MSQSSADVISGLYAAFGRGDVPGVLGALDDEIEWHAPEALPHGGDFQGREGVARFFEGIGEQWETLDVTLEDLVSGEDRVVALVQARGRLRATREETGYAAAHVWTLHNGAPMRFDEYVNAPISLPAAQSAAR